MVPFLQLCELSMFRKNIQIQKMYPAPMFSKVAKKNYHVETIMMEFVIPLFEI